MTGGEVAGSVAATVLLVNVVVGSVMKITDKLSPPKLTPADVEQMKWQTNLIGIQDEMRKMLEKLNDKGDERAKTLDEVHGISERSHRHIGETKDHLHTLVTQIASGDFCKGA